MRCQICDCEDDTITFDRTTGTFTDCRFCREVIADTLIYFETENEDEDDVLPETEIEADETYWIITNGVR